jgi:hypothetical protein
MNIAGTRSKRGVAETQNGSEQECNTDGKMQKYRTVHCRNAERTGYCKSIPQSVAGTQSRGALNKSKAVQTFAKRKVIMVLRECRTNGVLK